MSVITKDLGAVTAYAAAVNRGYTGTREEFETLMASYAYVGEQAAESASNASQSATNASQSAQNAETAKGTAQQAATDAQTAQASAQGYAQSAQQSAQSASQYAQSAESAKNTAVDAVDGFASGAQQALDSVNQAGNNWKSLAQAKALDSEAWAVGKRGGEDVGSSDPAYNNNAKWYALTAATDATTASDAAQTATTKAGEAQASAEAAAQSARTLTIDKTLTQPGQAADAKETGDKITGLNDTINEIHNEEDTLGYYATFENGGMASGVVNHDYNNRVTSDHLFEFDRAITLTPADGFRIYYSDLVNGSYINRGWHTEPVTLPAGTKFKIVIARINEASTSFYEDISKFVRAVTFATETEYRLNALESYKASADNIVTQVLSASKIVSGKYLDSSGVLTTGNNPDRLYYFDVEPDKNVIVKNIVNTGVRCACGFLDGVFVKAYTQSASTEQEFNTTGVNQIAVSLYYNVYDSVICAYKDYSVFTDYAHRLIGDNMVYDNAVGNYLNPVIDFGDVSIWESGYIKANGVTIEDSTSYKHSDYIRVYGGVDITATLLAGAEGRAVHFYDENKNWIGYVPTAFGTIPSLTFTTHKNTVYMRTTVANTPNNLSNMTIKYVGEIERNFFVNDMVNGWYTQGNKSIDKLFVKATKKPILTLIDDDTPTVSAVTLYHDSCVDNNVVGCYAVITQQLASQAGLADLLKTYEKDGFQNIFHCHSQIDAYNTSSANYNITNAEADMVQGIQEIIPYGFANWRYWCTPFGSYNNEFASLARKWGMKCLIRSGMTDYEGSVPHDGGKYQISRLSLNQSDDALAIIKRALDSAALVNGWVLVTTHMSEPGWDSSASQARFSEMITYARSLGFEIKTVGDALEIREPIYRFFETF